MATVQMSRERWVWRHAASACLARVLSLLFFFFSRVRRRVPSPRRINTDERALIIIIIAINLTSTTTTNQQQQCIRSMFTPQDRSIDRGGTARAEAREAPRAAASVCEMCTNAAVKGAQGERRACVCVQMYEVAWDQIFFSCQRLFFARYKAQLRSARTVASAHVICVNAK